MDKLEEYILFVEDTARFSERRQTVSNVYVLANSIVLSAVIFLVKDAGFVPVWRNIVVIPVLLAGIFICWQWAQLISKYKKLVGFRINQLRKMEETINGCFQMYHVEDELYPRDKDDPNKPKNGKGLNLSDHERLLPWVFIGVYVLFLIGVLAVLIFLPGQLESA